MHLDNNLRISMLIEGKGTKSGEGLSGYRLWRASDMPKHDSRRFCHSTPPAPGLEALGQVMVRATPAPHPRPPRPRSINIAHTTTQSCTEHTDHVQNCLIGRLSARTWNMGSPTHISLSAGCFEPHHPWPGWTRPLSRPTDCWDLSDQVYDLHASI